LALIKLNMYFFPLWVVLGGGKWGFIVFLN
jgi:hypothetical protein